MHLLGEDCYGCYVHINAAGKSFDMLPNEYVVENNDLVGCSSISSSETFDCLTTGETG